MDDGKLIAEKEQLEKNVHKLTVTRGELINGIKWNLNTFMNLLLKSENVTLVRFSSAEFFSKCKFAIHVESFINISGTTVTVISPLLMLSLQHRYR